MFDSMAELDSYAGHTVMTACRDQACAFCGTQATHSVTESRADLHLTYRLPTGFLCCEHFMTLMGTARHQQKVGNAS